MRVLLVSPHFPPTNAADMQRVRLLLPHLAAAGIEAEVLAVEAEQVAAPQDAWLEAGLPPEVPIHRVKALNLGWSKVPGLGILSYRALRAIRRKGNDLLGARAGAKAGETGDGRSKDGVRGPNFDLVYFSTTQFGLHMLGPEWKRRFGVPFVMDYQDPWVSDYYRDHPGVTPPGGRLKYGLMNWLARRQEPKVLRDCSGITSVSVAYPDQLARHYPWLDFESQSSEARARASGSRSQASGRRSLASIVLPFPGDRRDIERVSADKVRQSIFDPADGKRHWVYVGRGGTDMTLAVSALFSAISNLPSLRSTLRMHFIGTSYAAAGRGMKTIEPLAARYGLQEVVREYPDRIPYSETLRCLLDAEALIVPGSDDSGYTASKIYPYLLSGKALLAIFHQQSSVVELLRESGGGTAISFCEGDSTEDVAARITQLLSDNSSAIPTVPINSAAFAPHLARVQAMKLAEFFHFCLQ